MRRNLIYILSIFLFLVFTSAKTSSQIHEEQSDRNGFDQLELCRRLVGTWQQNISRDTVGIWEVKQIEKAFVSNGYLMVRGKRSFTFSQNWVFSSVEDRFIGFEFYSGGGYRTFVFSFVSSGKIMLNWIRNFNQERITGSSTVLFTSPFECKVTDFNHEGIRIGEYKLFKIK